MIFINKEIRFEESDGRIIEVGTNYDKLYIQAIDCENPKKKVFVELGKDDVKFLVDFINQNYLK